MKYKKYPIIIDPEFRALIPPLSPDERAQLKDNIRQHGLLDQIIVWGTSDGFVIIDGHHRYAILKELAADSESEFFEEDLEQVKGEPVEIGPDRLWHVRSTGIFRSESFANREDVKLWILEHQVGRRNLTDDQRAVIWNDIREQRSKIAKQERAIKGGKARQGKVSLPDTSSEKQKRDVLAETAKEAKLPERKLRSVQNIKHRAPELVERVRSGELSLSAAKKRVLNKGNTKVPDVTETVPSGKKDFRFSKSPNGHETAILQSWLQKAIRRGHTEDNYVDEALYAAVELDLAGFPGAVWNRLLAIASEDVGQSNRLAAVETQALYLNYQALKKLKNPRFPERLPLIDAVLRLAMSPSNIPAVRKSRLVDHALNVVYNERPKREVPEYVYDMHTKQGRARGKGVKEFFESESAFPIVDRDRFREDAERILTAAGRSVSKSEAA